MSEHGEWEDLVRLQGATSTAPARCQSWKDDGVDHQCEQLNGHGGPHKATIGKDETLTWK